MFVAVDHVALAVRDLETAVRGYATLFGGSPQRLGPGEVRFELPNLTLALVGPGAIDARLAGWLEAQGEGICAIALAAADPAGARRLLARRAVAVDDADPAAIAPESSHGVPLRIVGPRPPRSADLDPAPRVRGLDHIVITTAQPERAVAFYGGRLGLDLRLDRTNPQWQSRLLFFRCGDVVIEIMHALGREDRDAPDKAWGLAWRVDDVGAARERLAAAGVDVSAVKPGRKPGTEVCTVRDPAVGVPTLLIGPARQG